MKTINEYEKQGIDFLNETGVTMEVKFLRHDFHFSGDKEKRDIYQIEFKRGNRTMTLTFGQSINCSGRWWMFGNSQRGISHAIKKPYPAHEWDLNKNYQEPRAYDVLSCLTKYDPGTLENFCAEFGYDFDSKTAERTYNAVCKEWADVQKIWTDAEIEKMAEIQ